MNFKKLLKYTLIATLIAACILTIYVNSFEDIEQVCKDKKNTEVYLLNYVSKMHLKELVIKHNQNFKLESNKLTRVYLLKPILILPDPIFDSNINYKINGCEIIDNMDIYCEIRYSKSDSGKVNNWYNFMY